MCRHKNEKWSNSYQRHEISWICFKIPPQSPTPYGAIPLVFDREGEAMFASNVMQVFSGCLLTLLSDFPKLKRYS